jgi:hypothetical protein
VGEHFLITQKGVERLGTREIAPIATQA